MTRIDQITADVLAGSPETHIAILAREVVRLRGEAPAVVVPEWKTPADHPEWPEPGREGGLMLCSDVSVPVLGWIDNWGWFPVVLREDDDTEPSRYFWEDPMDCFTPNELGERLRGWIPMPPEPKALRASQGGADHA